MVLLPPGFTRASQDILEQCKSPRIVRLSEPEERLFPHGRIAIGLRNANQCRNSLTVRLLGQGEDGALADCAIDGVLGNQLREVRRNGLASHLAEPEHGVTSGLARYTRVARKLHQLRPDNDAVAEGGREDGFLSD